MRRLTLLLLAATLLAVVVTRAAETNSTYTNDFSKEEPGKMPDDFLVMSGAFAVRDDAGERFLELPGAPLETFGLLFGPALEGGGAASARFFGTKQGRKFPTFGVSLNGAGGYRLQVSPAKKMIEIYKGDLAQSSAAFEWASGKWTMLRVELRKIDTGWRVEGRAWLHGENVPEKALVVFNESVEPPAGRAGIWGSPYSGTPIRFDDLAVEAIP